MYKHFAFHFLGLLVFASSALASDVNRTQPFLSNSSGPTTDQLPTLEAAANRSSSCKSATQALISSAKKKNDSIVPMTSAQVDQFVKKFCDNAQSSGVPRAALERTARIFAKNQKNIYNQSQIAVVDFTKKSNQNRMFIFDIDGHLKAQMPTAHGRNSDRNPGANGTGFAASFSNKPGSRQSSVGCLLVGQSYIGEHGKSQMLVGFEHDSAGANVRGNDANCGRGITMHSATYVGDVPGRSYGCIAYNPKDRGAAKQIQDPAGTLLCTYPSPDDVDSKGRFPKVSQ